MRWVEAVDGYAVALEQGKILCKNAKGKVLSALPKKVRESDLVGEIRDLREHIALHEDECQKTVDAWMVRSLPVSKAVIEAVWRDPAWRSMLENAVVWPLDKNHTADGDRAGFLRGVDAKRGVGVVDLDGESRWLKVEMVALPHPILLKGELQDFRELATELSLEQRLSQLFRETFTSSAELRDGEPCINDFSGGTFELLAHATSRARKHGFRVSGGYAVCPVWGPSGKVEARYWLGADYWDEETETGDLSWVDEKEHSLAIAKVGAVAFSEGMRMASQIYAGRKVETDEEA
ncbi:MAG: DUF4132 domain-containing protein [Deltaproteobacteria bacterium]|nr:DUF4132 domain-containing protein [Deltaproteobacteria bacterium]